MKRTAILLLGAFYLLLTSGMYPCAVHCSVAKLVAKPQTQMACTKPCCKHADNTKKDDCSKKHGSFSIKENVKPGYQVRYTLPLLTLQPIHMPGYQLNTLPFSYTTRYINTKAPPNISGRALSIQLRSLLI